MSLFALGDRRPRTEGDYFVAPGASVIGNVRLGPDVSVWFGAVIRGDIETITIGRGSNVQDCAVLHTDPGAPLDLDQCVTVGHHAMLHGCRIGYQSLIGINSVVLNHAEIGRNCIVGAGSLITEHKRFPDGVLILGSPAKVVRELTDEELAGLAFPWQRYIENARRYREELIAL